MDTDTAPEQENRLSELNEMVLDHLGIPRPGADHHIRALQDVLLPDFMQIARYAWLMLSPYQPIQALNAPDDPIMETMIRATESRQINIRELNDILDYLGVHALLEDVVTSGMAPSLDQVQLDPYEKRLLEATGHPSPREATSQYLIFAATNPEVLAGLEDQLDRAEEAFLQAHSNLRQVFNKGRRVALPRSPVVAVPVAKRRKKMSSEPALGQRGAESGQAAKTTQKQNRRKLFTGLGTLFSGLTLLTGNAIFIPSVPMIAATVLPIISSLAGGAAAIGKGVGELLGES